MWGIIPAAGAGTRIQPLAFSKELLPVGSRFDGTVERPRAVSEHLVERLLLGGATRICFVISRDKSDILSYYGGRIGQADIAYAVQPQPAGLCDAIYHTSPPIDITEYADFCARMVRRYARNPSPPLAINGAAAQAALSANRT